MTPVLLPFTAFIAFPHFTSLDGIQVKRVVNAWSTHPRPLTACLRDRGEFQNCSAMMRTILSITPGSA
jgi:hypothetical protein